MLGNYYQLGGSFGEGSISVTPDEVRMLRGYRLGADFGDLYWIGGAEYRFPIAQINRGAGAWPLFMRNLSAAAFVDAGNAFVSPAAATGQPASFADIATAAGQDPLLGVGAEVSVRLVALWALNVTGRIGYGVGLLGEDRLWPTDPLAPAYARFGGSF